jgi:hypothetical protein
MTVSYGELVQDIDEWDDETYPNVTNGASNELNLLQLLKV